MLSAQLSTLESAGLIHVAQRAPDLEYLFRHALLQEAVYNSLLKNNRRELHLVVGTLLERERVGRGDEYTALLAHHFLEAGDDPRALHYLAAAGDAAARKHANAEAILHYTRALDIALRGVVSAETCMGSLFAHRGRAYELSGRYPEALANYDAMAARARAERDRAMELTALLSSATLYAIPSPVYDPVRGEALAQDVVVAARESGDRAIECRALWILMLLNTYVSRDPHQSVLYGERALLLARAQDLREQLAYILHDLYLAYFGVGDLAPAQAVLAEARTLWQELGILPMLADCLSRASHSHFCAGNFAQSIAFADESLRVSRTCHNFWQEANSRQMSCYAYLDQGRIAEAMTTMREMIAAADEGGAVPAQVGARADLGVTYAWLGDASAGLALTAESLRWAELIPLLRAWAFAAQARILLLQGNVTEADVLARNFRNEYIVLRRGLTVLVPAWAEIGLALGELALAQGACALVLSGMDDLLHSLRTHGIRPFVYDALWLKGKAFMAHGCRDEAEACLAEARIAAEAVGARRMLWRILGALGEIKAHRGLSADSRALRLQARAHINFMVEGLPSDALRHSFLNTADVRAIVSDP